jgi:hypothetical protein
MLWAHLWVTLLFGHSSVAAPFGHSCHICYNEQLVNYLLYLQIEVFHCEIKYITFALLQMLPAEKHII